MIKHLKIGILVLVAALFSCGKGEIDVPDYAIPTDSLVPILIDIHLADAYLSIHRTADRSMLKSEFYAAVLKKHGINKQRFDTTILFYVEYPEKYEEIYETVLEEFSKREAELLKESTTETETIEFTTTRNIDDTVYNQRSNEKFLEQIKQAKKRKEEAKRRDSLNVLN